MKLLIQRLDHMYVKLLMQNILLRSYSYIVIRSEEHTSELQSQSNLVCRLLLEKKKIRALIDQLVFCLLCEDTRCPCYQNLQNMTCMTISRFICVALSYHLFNMIYDLLQMHIMD